MDRLIVELRWGDAERIESALRGREAELAAIIVEPIQGAGGVRAADPAFLAFLRDYATRHGALLIFDEVISFRRPGRAQQRYGIDPDYDARQDHRGDTRYAFGGRGRDARV
jgi:glutamate-1-semialdehyde 2,1-aminomutase